MDYQTCRLALLDATGLHHLSDEQDELITWAAGAIDTTTAQALARLFTAIRIDAYQTAVRRGVR